MGDQAAINASPLIFLSRGDHLDLLRHFAKQFLVPRAVADEIQERGTQDSTARALSAEPWLKVVEAPPTPEVILEWGLGAGESAVLALALARPGTEAIIDDLAARKCAASLNIPVRGTLGIVLVAKKRGLIAEARPVMEELIRGGLFLSRAVLDEALKRVGE